jgi:hypothetical protein
MTGDLSEPAHGRPASLRGRGTALRASGRRARPGSGTLPRGRHPFPRGRDAAGSGARLGGAGHLRETELRLEEQARTHRLKARLEGLCRRSPPAGDRWHIRQPVPAARFTAVLPRGSSADTGRAHRNRQGDGDTAEGSVFRGAGDLGVVAGTRGVRSGRWRCRSGARLPTACDPSASLPRPAPSRPERAWPLGYPARSSAGLPERSSSRRAPYIRQGQARCARPFGTLDGGAVVPRGSSRARASCWPAGLC